MLNAKDFPISGQGTYAVRVTRCGFLRRYWVQPPAPQPRPGASKRVPRPPAPPGHWATRDRRMTWPSIGEAFVVLRRVREVYPYAELVLCDGLFTDQVIKGV